MTKALCESKVQNGPTTPFTGEIITHISDVFLCPYDWSLWLVQPWMEEIICYGRENLEKCQEQT